MIIPQGASRCVKLSRTLTVIIKLQTAKQSMSLPSKSLPYDSLNIEKCAVATSHPRSRRKLMQIEIMSAKAKPT